MTKEYVELKDGAYRIAGTRVSLDSVVYGYRRGESAESIRQSFPTLTLEQIHGAFAFYLGNKEKIDKYLAESEIMFERLREESREKNKDLIEKLEKARKEMLLPH